MFHPMHTFVIAVPNNWLEIIIHHSAYSGKLRYLKTVFLVFISVYESPLLSLVHVRLNRDLTAKISNLLSGFSRSGHAIRFFCYLIYRTGPNLYWQPFKDIWRLIFYIYLISSRFQENIGSFVLFARHIGRYSIRCFCETSI